MEYKYETHMHTARSSACGMSFGPEYLKGYRDLGYDGVFVTEHFYNGNTCVPRELPWSTWVRRYCRAYEETKEAGDALGLKVFFGWESTFGGGEDFLIYGLSPQWLERHPEIIQVTPEEQFRLVDGAGGLVVQAHPYRQRWYMSEVRLHPYHCHAWEVANAGNTAAQDRRAMDIATELGLTVTCGSDIHGVKQLEEGNVFPMITEQPLYSAADYVALIKSGKGFCTGFPADRMDCEPCENEMDAYLRERDGRLIRL